MRIRQAGPQRVISDVEDLLTVVHAAEKRYTVPLHGEFVPGQTGVSVALNTALEKASNYALDKLSKVQKQPPVATADGADKDGNDKANKTPRASTGSCASERLQAVISEAEEEMAQNMETANEMMQQDAEEGALEPYGAQHDDIAGFKGLALMLSGNGYDPSLRTQRHNAEHVCHRMQ
jgi:hypothetical protein